LVNPDPTKKYVLVDKGSWEMGPEYYLDIGFNTVEYREGGTKISGRTCKPGEDVEYMGSVLMEIDKERAEEIDRHGLFGDGGQARADQIEEQIIEKGGGVDTLRGLHGIGATHGFLYQNKTEPSEPEGPF
jgi:hypothetical protein